MAKRSEKSRPYRPRADAKTPADYFFRQWRLKRGLTVERAAELAGMSPAAISQLESGEQGVSDRSLKGLMRAYKCTLAELFTDPVALNAEVISTFQQIKPERRAEAIALLKVLAGKAA